MRLGLAASLLLLSQLALAQDDDPGVARRYDDPGLARRFEAPAITATATPASPAAAAVPDSSFVQLALGAGYASPFEDPDLNEGWGAALALKIGRRLGGELRLGFAHHDYVAQLDDLGLDYWTGDVTPGGFWRFLQTNDWTVFAAGGFGPYWMVGLNGLTWSLGVRVGGGVEWQATSWLGVQLELHYHLYHLAEIAGGTYYNRRSFQTVGAVDRFDLPLSLVFHL